MIFKVRSLAPYVEGSGRSEGGLLVSSAAKLISSY